MATNIAVIVNVHVASLGDSRRVSDGVTNAARAATSSGTYTALDTVGSLGCAGSGEHRPGATRAPPRRRSRGFARSLAAAPDDHGCGSAPSGSWRWRRRLPPRLPSTGGNDRPSLDRPVPSRGAVPARWPPWCRPARCRARRGSHPASADRSSDHSTARTSPSSSPKARRPPSFGPDALSSAMPRHPMTFVVDTLATTFVGERRTDELPPGHRHRAAAGLHRAVPGLQPRPLGAASPAGSAGTTSSTGQSADESFYLAFLVGLHVATAIALVVFFRRDWVAIIRGFFTSLRNRRIETPDQRMAWLLILGTIPVGLFGLAFEHSLRTRVRQTTRRRRSSSPSTG